MALKETEIIKKKATELLGELASQGQKVSLHWF